MSARTTIALTSAVIIALACVASAPWLNRVLWTHPLALLLGTAGLTLVCYVQAHLMDRALNRKPVTTPARVVQRPSYGPLMHEGNAWLDGVIAAQRGEILARPCVGTPDGMHVQGWSEPGTCVACMPVRHHATPASPFPKHRI